MTRQVFVVRITLVSLCLAAIALYANRSALLFYGAQDGNVPLVKMALAVGANPNMRYPRSDGNYDKSALMAAAWDNRLNTARILLAHGADPNMPGPAGVTALFAAVLSDNPQIASLLLAHGANWNVRYKDGTPLYESVPRGADPSFSQMLRHTGTPL